MMNKRPAFAVVLAACGLFFLAACGFHPVYGTHGGASGPAEAKLGAVEIGNIPNREGQYVRNALIDRFYREGRPGSALYRLDVGPISEERSDLDITKSSDATRAQLRLDSVLTLRDARTGETLLRRSVRSITSFNVLDSEFATRVTEENARTNGLDELARQIELQLALYFNRGGT